ncbi:MAG: hypothetical protein WKF77_18325 [Planctomycetaceae bacterium]
MDEFQVLYRDLRIVGDVGLQSGGDSGTTFVTAVNSSDELTVKVTAPKDGTAWNFRVETQPVVLEAGGFLGDVVKVDVVDLLRRAGVSVREPGVSTGGMELIPNEFGLKSTTNIRVVAQVDDWE